MDWTEVSVMTTSEAVEAVSNILMEHGASGVSIEDAKDFAKLKPGRYGDHGEIIDPDDLTHITQGAIVSAYYPNNQHIDQQAARIGDEVRGLSKFNLNPGPAEITITPVANKDWQTAWEKYRGLSRLCPVGKTINLNPTRKKLSVWIPAWPLAPEPIRQHDCRCRHWKSSCREMKRSWMSARDQAS